MRSIDVPRSIGFVMILGGTGVTLVISSIARNAEALVVFDSVLKILDLSQNVHGFAQSGVITVTHL
jgi:hypothetical protein